MTAAVSTSPTAHAAASRPAAGTALNLDSLHAWLRPHVPGLPALTGDLRAERLVGGQSNPTWVLRAQGGPPAWVLRAKPGPAAQLLASAHAIEREYKVMHALAGSDVPVPAVRALCEDESVIGAAFYVMDFVPGRVFREAAIPDVSREERAALHDEANRVIAALHRVDWAAAGLEGYGRSDPAYFERMVSRWTRQYRASLQPPDLPPLPSMEALIEWLPAHIPAEARSGETRLIHGDYRIENLLFHPSEPRVLAVLDWELSTLGHPLSDLAYHCLSWHHAPGVLQGFAGLELAALGIPSERAYIERYCERTGRQDLEAVMAHWPFYLAYNLFRLSAILLGIGRRVLDGTAAHPKAREIAAQAGPVADLGWRLVQDGHRPS